MGKKLTMFSGREPGVFTRLTGEYQDLLALSYVDSALDFKTQVWVVDLAKLPSDA